MLADVFGELVELGVGELGARIVGIFIEQIDRDNERLAGRPGLEEVGLGRGRRRGALRPGLFPWHAHGWSPVVRLRLVRAEHSMLASPSDLRQMHFLTIDVHRVAMALSRPSGRRADLQATQRSTWR